MRELVKVASLQKEEQNPKQIENEDEVLFEDIPTEMPPDMLNEEPNGCPDEFDLFLLGFTEEEELAELEKIVCRMDDDAFNDDEVDAEDYIEPEETTVKDEANKDGQSTEVSLEQLCKEDNSTPLGESNKDMADENLELESEVTTTKSSLRVDKYVDLPKEVDSTLETTLKCSACIKGFTDEDSFNKHMATHANVHNRRSKTKRKKAKPRKAHTCEICCSGFSRKTNFVRHNIMTHLDKKPYTCYLCHKVYQLRYRLVSHLRRHTEVKVFTCDKCQTNFRNKKTLIDHLQIHTDEKCYKCDICSAQFAKKCYIRSHMRTHTGGKRFACDFCDNKFSTKQNLETHENIHTGEKPLACEQCPLMCANKSILLSHMKTHTRGKFTCDICKKECQNMFEYKRCFLIHMKALASAKLFTCLVCHNKFDKKSNLNTHLSTHTGEKPFACTVCDHKFTCNNNLVCHMRSHTDVKLYGCKLCNKKLAHKRNLRDHMRSHEKAVR